MPAGPQKCYAALQSETTRQLHPPGSKVIQSPYKANLRIDGKPICNLRGVMPKTQNGHNGFITSDNYSSDWEIRFTDEDIITDQNTIPL